MHDPIEEKSTRRLSSSESLAIQELTETRKHLRELIASGKATLPEIRLAAAARARFIGQLVKAETFLRGLLILIVPTFFL